MKLLLIALILSFTVADANAFVSLFGRKKYQLMEAAVQENNKALAQLNSSIDSMQNEIDVNTQVIASINAQVGAFNTAFEATVTAGGDASSIINQPEVIRYGAVLFGISLVSNFLLLVVVFILKYKKNASESHLRAFTDAVKHNPNLVLGEGE